MKLTYLYLAAQLATLTASAPAPIHQFKGLETRPWPHVPHKEQANPPKGRWRFGLPKTVTEMLVLGGNGNKDTRISNMPWIPPKTAEPSGVLAAERPLTTEYLLSHRPMKVPSVDGRKGEAKRPEPVRQHQQMEAEAEHFEVSEMEIAIAIPSRMGAPCHYARLSRDRNDMLVVFAAVAFLLVVLAVETWGPISNSVGVVFGRRGAIRLEDEEDCVVVARQPLSIQADDSASEGSEKP